MSLRILSLTLHCRFRTSAQLPVFKGSALRGAFGHALKKIACTLKKQECPACLLAKNCAYGLIFATEKVGDARVTARPHPYILNPPATAQERYQEDDAFAFNLVLLGPAVDFLPHIVCAVEEMGRQGLGLGASTGRGRFALLSVFMQSAQGEALLYGEHSKTLRSPERIQELSWDFPAEEGPGEACIDLLTPLRLKEQNSLTDRVDFADLIRAALRRITLLESHYGDGGPALRYEEILQEAQGVAVSHAHLHWQEYRRYSNRQKQSMLFGGIMGSLYVCGTLGPFLPILRYAEQVNLGKQTAFGLGRIRVTLPETSE